MVCRWQINWNEMLSIIDFSQMIFQSLKLIEHRVIIQPHSLFFHCVGPEVCGIRVCTATFITWFKNVLTR